MKSTNLNRNYPKTPYGVDIPSLPKRPYVNMSIPETHEDKLYCWYYWIEKILNPRTTGMVLENIDRLPEFRASWGAEWKKGQVLFEKNAFSNTKNKTFINKTPR